MYTQLQKAKQQYSNKDFVHFNNQAQQAAKTFKQSEKLLIQCLQKVYTTSTHSYFGFNSLFNYAHKGLDLTESQAYSFCAVAKASLQCEALGQAIEDNSLSVSKAARIVSMVDGQNAHEWVEKAKRLTKRELEKQIASANPRAKAVEHCRFIAADLLQLQAGISEDCFKKLQRAQELLLQKDKVHGKTKIEDVLQWALNELLEKHDPVKKAERAKERQIKKALPSAITSKTRNKNANVKKTTKTKYSARAERLPLKASVKHQVFLRDKGQCQFKLNSGQICEQKTHLDLHHIKPLSHGGSDLPHNLITLCKAHHQYIHREG